MWIVESKARVEEVCFVIDCHPIDKFKTFGIDHDDDITILKYVVLLFGPITIELDDIT